MLKKTAFHAVPAVLALMLAACASQQPAPVTAGNASGSTSASNPYGAEPYNPNAAGNAETPYTPPPAQSASASSGGAYIPSNAPVDINAATHTVVRGDTVYNISKRYNITQDNLRAWNNMADNTISVGQTLRVKPAGYSAPASSASAPAVSAPAGKPASTYTPAPKVSSAAPAPSASGISLMRPTAGKVVTNFGGSSKGVDIVGQPGQPVVAAADGKVVYAGSGLRGYGNLVIIQHNKTFLTAYGHNQSLLVNEGQTVKRGQTIAKMGNSDASRTQLHFEVRQNGKPVNPASYVSF
ncbi:peptidoglycan DD-metalloendopeptidase family protein [Neisseria chenwenguii]|uniref:Peptidoglycan-binding protein LysM n=1 Tax=Neisseria chenwenguii TaxID=1853278 RepID=A0A220S3Q2_9NEIS|nr:peptidoglycan DD-metalloendopeptidase family protein [Neisseria chenwenguii]ASK28057.1 peptidoglycan-binding protein LysM [Neisseria chenwenguii]ROV57207.1 LysM peptidoglycan-binding domain-containing protein [Neisseria chenwenguii]